jgi:poly-gamma-glutamate capsule biosynthesis protein CapA/YwtB (metallophosphatase superfamily)
VLPCALPLGIALGLLAGCSGPADRPVTTPSAVGTAASPSGSGGATTSPSGSSSPPAAAGTGPIRLAFAGDVHFTAQLAGLADRPDGLAELTPYLAGADLAMVNLETAITDRAAPEPKQFHFRTSPAALRTLAGAGVDVVTMANNHAVDYGPDGLTDTLTAREHSPIPIVGIGQDADEAYAPAYLTVRGLRVAVLGGTQIPDWTLAHWSASDSRGGVASAARPTRLAAAVRAARARADLVVVYLHWGTDYTQCPNALQRSTARALTEAGADVVLGAHAHQLQGGGWLGRSYVDYGLGNFVWWRRNNEVDARSGVLTLTLTGRRVTGAAWTPMRVSPDGIPRVPADPAQQRDLLAKWDAVRDCSGLAAAPD